MAGRAKRKRQVSKTCRRCAETKPVEEFVKDSTRSDGYFPWCKECHSQKQAEYKKIHVVGDGSSEDRKCGWCGADISGAHFNRKFCKSFCKEKSKRVEKFGLTPEEYHKLVESTGGKCPICERRIKRWNLDHNHDTGETTGIVCTTCNIGLLAYSNHQVKWAKNLVAFLENPPIRVMFGERRFVGPQAASHLHRRWLWTGKEADEADDAA